MTYISKRYAPKKRIKWIGLVDLLALVRDESGCSVEEAREQIRDALEDGAIWQLRWEPMAVSSDYCQYKNERVPGSDATTPVFPPPLVPGIREYFIDQRRASHWQAIKIDWEQGRVFDDFDREAERRLSKGRQTLHKALAFPGLAPPCPKPRRPKWRTLWFDHEACERIWPPASNVSEARIEDDDQAKAFYPKGTKLEAVRQHIQQTYPQGIPGGITDKTIAAELMAEGIDANVRTIRRARRGK